MSQKHRRRFTSPLDRVRNAVLGFLFRPFSRFRPRTRFFIFYGLFVVATTLLLVNANSRVSVENYREGDVVRRTVIAPADISVPDLAETEKRREAAREATRPVFAFDPTRAKSAAQSFRSAWEDLQKQATQPGNSNARKELRWTGPGGRSALVDALVARRFDPAELEQLERILRELNDGYIYEDGDAEYLKQDIVLANMMKPEAQSVFTMPQSHMNPLSERQKDLRSRISQLSGWTTDEQQALFAAMSPLVRPNVFYDPAASQNVREAAAGKVEPAYMQLKRNQVIAREGDTVSGPMLAQMQAVRDYARQGRRWWNQLFGLFFLVAALYWLTWKFIEHRSTAVTLNLSPRKAFALVGSAVVVQTILARVGFTLAESIATRGMTAPLNDPVIWDFAVPFASATLLVALLVDTQLGLITALVTSLFAGLLAPTGILVTFYAVISSTAAIYGIGRYRERQSVTVAGLLIAAVNAMTAVAIIAYAQQPLTLKSVLFTMGCGVLGGLLTTIFTAGGLPINESAFGILTDVKLLELSNADLPVFGQLALRAPGTNQHSHAVGQLAEDACRAVGANPLLARIGALYHDIGKTAAPDYFVENQTGENPHDRLKPTQSAKHHHESRHLRPQARQGDRAPEADFRLHPAAPRHAHAPLLPAQGAGAGRAGRGGGRVGVPLPGSEAAVQGVCHHDDRRLVRGRRALARAAEPREHTHHRHQDR